MSPTFDTEHHDALAADPTDASPLERIRTLLAADGFLAWASESRSAGEIRDTLKAAAAALQAFEGIPVLEVVESAGGQCRGPNCKTPVIWAHNPNTGKPMPLDGRAPVYRVVLEGGKPTAVRDRAAFVGHHATCQDVGQFSGRNRGGPS